MPIERTIPKRQRIGNFATTFREPRAKPRTRSFSAVPFARLASAFEAARDQVALRRSLPGRLQLHGLGLRERLPHPLIDLLRFGSFEEIEVAD